MNQYQEFVFIFIGDKFYGLMKINIFLDIFFFLFYSSCGPPKLGQGISKIQKRNTKSFFRCYFLIMKKLLFKLHSSFYIFFYANSHLLWWVTGLQVLYLVNGILSRLTCPSFQNYWTFNSYLWHNSFTSKKTISKCTVRVYHIL